MAPPIKPARIARVEEIALTPNDFRVVAGGPSLVRGIDAVMHDIVVEEALTAEEYKAGRRAKRSLAKKQVVASEPGALFWTLPKSGDAIEAALDMKPGDRVLAIETDITIGLGYMALDLIELSPAGRVPLLHVEGQNAASSRPFQVRRTIGPDASVVLRIWADLAGEPRRVFGCYLRVVRAA